MTLLTHMDWPLNSSPNIFTHSIAEKFTAIILFAGTMIFLMLLINSVDVSEDKAVLVSWQI